MKHSGAIKPLIIFCAIISAGTSFGGHLTGVSNQELLNEIGLRLGGRAGQFSEALATYLCDTRGNLTISVTPQIGKSSSVVVDTEGTQTDCNQEQATPLGEKKTRILKLTRIAVCANGTLHQFVLSPLGKITPAGKAEVGFDTDCLRQAQQINNKR